MQSVPASGGSTTPPRPLHFIQAHPLITLLVVTLLALLVTLGVMALVGRQNPGEFISQQFKSYKTAYLVGALAYMIAAGLSIRYASQNKPTSPLPKLRIFSEDDRINLLMDELVRDIRKKSPCLVEAIYCTATSEAPPPVVLQPGQKEVTFVMTYELHGPRPWQSFIPKGCDPATSYLIKTGGGMNEAGCVKHVSNQFGERQVSIMMQDGKRRTLPEDLSSYSTTIDYLASAISSPLNAPLLSLDGYRLQQMKLGKRVLFG